MEKKRRFRVEKNSKQVTMYLTTCKGFRKQDERVQIVKQCLIILKYLKREVTKKVSHIRKGSNTTQGIVILYGVLLILNFCMLMSRQQLKDVELWKRLLN